MTRRNLLAVIGGSWHDFAGFAAWLGPVVAPVGCEPRVTSDLAELENLVARSTDVVLLYNCIDEGSEQAYSDDQIDALCGWVEGGGRLLALHSATVAARQRPRLRALLGGAFIDHPPRCELEVKPVGEAHPMVADILPFRVQDELYRHDIDPSVQIHLIASDGREEQAVGWTRHVQRGKTAYLALGHDGQIWGHPAFARILQQSLVWLLGDPP